MQLLNKKSEERLILATVSVNLNRLIETETFSYVNRNILL